MEQKAKKYLYVMLMMGLFGIISVGLYLSSLTLIFKYRIISPLFFDSTFFYYVIIGDITYGSIFLIGSVLGYFIGQKWWKIIYVDGVYYFKKRKHSV